MQNMPILAYIISVTVLHFILKMPKQAPTCNPRRYPKPTSQTARHRSGGSGWLLFLKQYCQAMENLLCSELK